MRKAIREIRWRLFRIPTFSPRAADDFGPLFHYKMIPTWITNYGPDFYLHRPYDTWRGSILGSEQIRRAHTVFRPRTRLIPRGTHTRSPVLSASNLHWDWELPSAIQVFRV